MRAVGGDTVFELKTTMSGTYSYQTGVKRTFSTEDYVVFGATLAISAAIGVFYAIKDRNKKSTEEYLLAGRAMHYIPVAMSLLSSFISAITILGTPAEVYVYSTMYWWIGVGVFITALGAANIYIPIFYNLGITSIFEYAEMRFGRVTRIIACIIYLIWMVFYMAIVLYAPSLALNAVTGLSLWGSIAAVSCVCIFYTALGGMKAVLWADTVQMCIVYAGMISVLVVGSDKLGGFGEAWDIADRNGRIVIWEFNPDPRVRHTVWNVVIGGGIFWCAVFGTNQAQVQRALSVSSLRRSKTAIWLNWPGMASIIILSCMVGVVMFAFYSKCDPVKFGLVDKADQLLPLYMMDLFGEKRGLPGLLLSCVFSGSLSTMSSGLNAVAAVLLEDFVRPMCCKKLSPANGLILSRLFVILSGGVSLAFAFVVSQVGSMILQLAYVLFGILGGPLLGMFTLGMLFPWANKWGGGIGLVTSLAFVMWIGLGTTFSGTNVTIKPSVSTEDCNWAIYNKSITANTTTTMATAAITTLAQEASTSIYDKYTGIYRLYTISYIWYSGLAVVTTVVVGMVVSLITGVTDTKTLNPKLICPFFDIFFFWLPERIRKPLRFGVRHGEDWVEGDAIKDKTKKERLNSFQVNNEIRLPEKERPPPNLNGVNGKSFDNKAFQSGFDTRL